MSKRSMKTKFGEVDVSKSTEISAVNNSRRALIIQNKSDEGNLCIAFGCDATTEGGLSLTPGEKIILSDVSCSVHAIAVFDVIEEVLEEEVLEEVTEKNVKYLIIENGDA